MSTTASASAPTMNDVVTEEVRVLLARHNLRPKALCPVLGLSQQGVSTRMTGARLWSIADLDALAGFFGVDANALLPGLGQVDAGQRAGVTPPVGTLAGQGAVAHCAPASLSTHGERRWSRTASPNVLLINHSADLEMQLA